MADSVSILTRCFVDGVEYDQTIIQLRAEADLSRDRDTGKMEPYNLRASADIETANPKLIAKLFEANFNNERINVLVAGNIRAEASNGLITTHSVYATNESTASFKLNFGSPIRVAVPKPGKK